MPVLSYAGTPIVTVQAESYLFKTIYNSPQEPGYTAWTGAWINPDKSIGVAFGQATGPVANPPDRDHSALTNINIYMESSDGKTFTKVKEDPLQNAAGGGIHPISVSAQSAIILKNGTLIRRVNGEDIASMADVPASVHKRTAYLQRLAPGSRTWSAPQYLLDPATKTYQLSRIQYLKDGRLIATGQVWHAPADQRVAGTKVEALLMVSSDQGRTWQNGLTIPTNEPCMFPNEWDAAEAANGDLVAVFRSRTLTAAGQPCSTNTAQVRNQALLVKSGAGWLMTKVRSAPFTHSGHPELLATKEGVILHFATTGINYTVDKGTTWQSLRGNGMPATNGMYYPSSVQAADGTIYVFSHTQGDISYGAADTRIDMMKFKLSIKQ
jgi:hypothetical protein